MKSSLIFGEKIFSMSAKLKQHFVPSADIFIHLYSLHIIVEMYVFLKLHHEVWFMSRHKNNLVGERSWSALDYQGWYQACSNYQWFFSQTSDQIANLKTCYFGLHILSHRLVTCHNEYLNLQSNLMSQM